MKRAILFLFLGISALYATELYSQKVKMLYDSPSSKKVIGKLLPTNALSVLQKVDNRILISIRGYQNQSTPNVIYFNDSSRIIVAAFAKNITLQPKLIKKGESGKWDFVELSLYTEDEDLSEDLQSLFTKAAETYKNGCSMCHALHEPTHYTANQWPGLLKSMLSRTAIDKGDEMLIVQYLQKHASDTQHK